MTSVPDLVDFHCHLDLYPDLPRAVARCDARRAATLAVTTTPKAFTRNRQVAASSEFVRVALGLHPQLVVERADEIDLFERLLPETRYVGEVGLDASPRYYRSLEAQIAVFRRVLTACASVGGKILTVHSVRSARQVLDLVEANLPQNRGTVVLHWFTGTVPEVKRAVALGCYFSVNQQMLSSTNGRKVTSAVPLDRTLTETDGPFIHDDRGPISPGDVAAALTGLAALHAIDEQRVRKTVIDNFAALIRTATSSNT